MIDDLDNTYQSTQERGHPYKSQTRKIIHGKIDDLDNVDFISSTSNVHSSREEALLYIFEDKRSSDQDDNKGKKSNNETCFPGPTELLLIGYSIESIWTPRSKSNTFDTKNQLADILKKGNSHTWWVESSFVFV